MSDLLETLSDVLAGHAGTAGIPRPEAPAPLEIWTGFDAFIISTDNELS